MQEDLIRLVKRFKRIVVLCPDEEFIGVSLGAYATAAIADERIEVVEAQGSVSFSPEVSCVGIYKQKTGSVSLDVTYLSKWESYWNDQASFNDKNLIDFIHDVVNETAIYWTGMGEIPSNLMMLDTFLNNKRVFAAFLPELNENIVRETQTNNSELTSNHNYLIDPDSVFSHDLSGNVSIILNESEDNIVSVIECDKVAAYLISTEAIEHIIQDADDVIAATYQDAGKHYSEALKRHYVSEKECRVKGLSFHQLGRKLNPQPKNRLQLIEFMVEANMLVPLENEYFKLTKIGSLLSLPSLGISTGSSLNYYDYRWKFCTPEVLSESWRSFKSSKKSLEREETEQ